MTLDQRIKREYFQEFTSKTYPLLQEPGLGQNRMSHAACGKNGLEVTQFPISKMPEKNNPTQFQK